jgi:hypothetical protein
VGVVATAVVGITDGETVFGLTPSELVCWEDPDSVRVVATAVVDSADGETVIRVWDTTTAVVGIKVGGTSVEVSGSVLVSGGGFRYNSETSTAPAISTTATQTETRIFWFIRERITLKHHEDS